MKNAEFYFAPQINAVIQFVVVIVCSPFLFEVRKGVRQTEQKQKGLVSTNPSLKLMNLCKLCLYFLSVVFLF